VLDPPDDDKSRDKHVVAGKGSAFGRGFDSRRLHFFRISAEQDGLNFFSVGGRTVRSAAPPFSAMAAALAIRWLTVGLRPDGSYASAQVLIAILRNDETSDFGVSSRPGIAPRS
jgi:hypothetical protein